MGSGLTPLARLQALAGRQPRAPALCTRRRGRWWQHDWSRLAADAQALRAAWSARGLGAGGELLLLGPLSPAAVATLIALPSLGATVVVARACSREETAAIGRATHVFADGSHELERVMRHAGPALRHVVVVDDVADDLGAREGGAPVGVHWRLETVPALLGTPAEAAAPDGAGDGVPGSASSAAPERSAATTAATLPAPASFGTADRVLADFEPHWAPGVEFLLGPWLAQAATLLLPEPGGDPQVDRDVGRPTVWLAPAGRLDDFVASWTGRIPARGLGARLARGLLATPGSRGLAARVTRGRLRRGLAVDRLRLILTDDAIRPATTAGLAALALPQPAPVGAATQAATGTRPAAPGPGETAERPRGPALAGSAT